MGGTRKRTGASKRRKRSQSKNALRYLPGCRRVPRSVTNKGKPVRSMGRPRRNRKGISCTDTSVTSQRAADARLAGKVFGLRHCQRGHRAHRQERTGLPGMRSLGVCRTRMRHSQWRSCPYSKTRSALHGLCQGNLAQGREKTQARTEKQKPRTRVVRRAGRTQIPPFYRRKALPGVRRVAMRARQGILGSYSIRRDPGRKMQKSARFGGIQTHPPTTTPRSRTARSRVKPHCELRQVAILSNSQ